MRVILIGTLLTLLSLQVLGVACAADTSPVRLAYSNSCHWFSTPEEATLFAQTDPRDNAGRARYYAALLDLHFKDVALVHDEHTKASCYAFIMATGPMAVYFLIITGETSRALYYATRLARTWSVYHTDSQLGSNSPGSDREAYDDLPIDLAHAIYYKCSPAAPDGNCPWPPPKSVTAAVMQQLISSQSVDQGKQRHDQALAVMQHVRSDLGGCSACAPVPVQQGKQPYNASAQASTYSPFSFRYLSITTREGATLDLAFADNSRKINMAFGENTPLRTGHGILFQTDRGHVFQLSYPYAVDLLFASRDGEITWSQTISRWSGGESFLKEHTAFGQYAIILPAGEAARHGLSVGTQLLGLPPLTLTTVL